MADNIPLSIELPQERRYITGGSFSPTMVIGLGGTGAAVVRRMKLLMRRRYGSEWNLIRYLCIDTDSATFGNVSGLPNIENPEQCDISVLKKDAYRVVRELKGGGRKELRQWFFDGLYVDVLLGKGAGTVRPCGRFCLFTNFNKVNTALDRAIDDLAKIETRLETIEKPIAEGITIDSVPTIYIISSCCGGSGAGMFLDIAALLKHKYQANPPKIKGIFAMPSAFIQESQGKPQKQQRLQANAVAALTELQYFMDQSELDERPWTFAYPGETIVNIDSPILDECFLVEGKNDNGESLDAKEQVYELISRALIQEVSPVGAQVASRQVDHYAAGLLDDCIETGRPRIFSSFAVTSVVLPANELLTYCCLNRALEMIKYLKGQVTEVESEVRSFEQGLHLYEFGRDNNQILDILRTRTQTGQPSEILDGSQFRLTVEALRDDPVAVQSAKLCECEKWVKGVLEPLLKKNRSVMDGRTRPTAEQANVDLKDKTGQIKDHMHSVLRNGGLDLVRAWLLQLKSDFAAMRGEITSESQDYAKMDWKNQVKVCQSKCGGFRLGDKSDIDLADIHNRLVTQMALEPSRKEAIELLHLLSVWTDVMLGEVETARTQLDKVEHDLTHARSSLEARFRESSSAPGGYTLERGAMTQEDFTTFYKSKAGDGSTAAREWIGETADALDVLKLPSDQLARHLPEFCRRYFDADVSATNVIDVLGMGLSDDGKQDLVKRRLDSLFNLCRPFWQMIPREDQEFAQSLLVGVPVPQPVSEEDDPGAPVVATVQEWMDSKLAAGDNRPTPVRTGYPFSIEIARRVYGARPYYHAEWATWKRNYDSIAAKDRTSKRKQPLHVHRDFETALQDMEPLLEPQVTFALAVAFGYIARKGTRYLFGLQPGKSGLLVPKYKSDLPTVWVSKTPPKLALTAVKSDEFCSSCTRTEAMQAFMGRNTLCEQARKALEHLIESNPKTYVSALTRYYDLLDKETTKESVPERQRQLRLELQCIDRETERVAEIL